MNMKGGSRTRFPNVYNLDQQIDVAQESPRYMLEHLATFSVGPEFGLVSPKDGLYRLLQMEKSNGIWTQKMQMQLDKNWVIILDCEDGDVVERFPMNLISDPTAYTSDDPRELYNNILVFVVKEDPKNKMPNLSEMHIFQCARVYAQDVVDEMKMFMTGKVKTKYSENIRQLPPPPHNPPPEPPINGNGSKVRDQVAMFSTSASSSSPTRPQHHRSSSSPQQRLERSSARESNDETSSTTSDKYEREVTILNHCFDDIERFVVRLQHAAAAYKELERRQKSRKHKKKDMGDGMLSIRAKPPPEREFMDILQKFKLSFNLLAKLKSHIHDPNAPELVHFLFTPLALIVDAARDANHSVNVAGRVVSPLLTRDAIELLINCCSSKETDLWHSLGDSWIIPRDQWKGYESSYHPVFSNGWAPENLVDDGNSMTSKLHRGEEQDYQRVFSHPERDSRYGSEYFGSERGDDQDHVESPGRQYDPRSGNLRRDILDRGSIVSPESDFHDPQDRDVRSEFSTDSIEHGDVPINPQRQFDRQQMQWLEDLKRRRAKVVQVVYPRTANNDKELTVIRGEILEVLDDSRKWWKSRNMHGQVAHVPHTIVSPYPSVDDDVFNNPMYATQSSREGYYSQGESSLKEHFLEDGPARPQDAAHGPPMINSQSTPADWVRRERQDALPAKSEKPQRSNAMIQTEDSTTQLPSPPPHLSPPTYREHLKLVPSSPGWLSLPPENTVKKLPRANPAPPKRQFYEDFADIDKVENFNVSSVVVETEMKESLPVKPSTSEPSCQLPKPPLPIKNDENQKKDSDPGNERALHALFQQRNDHELCPPDPSPPPDVRGVRKQSVEELAQGLLHEELRATVERNKENRRIRVGCPDHQKAECFYITQSSLEEDVIHWLKLKGFSERALDVLRGMTGEMLFCTKKSQLQKFLGQEGIRLHSNLIVQKNVCGFTTCSAQQLKSILEERRQKTEG